MPSTVYLLACKNKRKLICNLYIFSRTHEIYRTQSSKLKAVSRYQGYIYIYFVLVIIELEYTHFGRDANLQFMPHHLDTHTV